jgi:hypothetical protein
MNFAIDFNPAAFKHGVSEADTGISRDEMPLYVYPIS